VTKALARALKQRKPFASPEEEIVLSVRHLATRIMEPWGRYLKTTAQLSLSQYNVLRILRGAHPTRLPSSDISERMIARDPDVTRLVDRLAERELVYRVRHQTDRRVVEVGITDDGLELLATLDPAVKAFPKAMLSRVGARQLDQLNELLQNLLGNLGTFDIRTK